MKTAREKLDEALGGIDWNANVVAFRAAKPEVERIADRTLRIAIWAKQFEITDAKNPALSFVREMQASAQQFAALVALALYKPAASTMRSMVECAFYYTYFRTHASELATLLRDPEFYVDKELLVNYHRIHTPDFPKAQAAFGLLSKLNSWYKSISAITHGQIPGHWVAHTSLGGIRPVTQLLTEVVAAYCDGEDIVHSLFLCTVGRELWADFSTSAKQKLLSGVSGDIKKMLNLDMA